MIDGDTSPKCLPDSNFVSQKHCPLPPSTHPQQGQKTRFVKMPWQNAKHWRWRCRRLLSKQIDLRGERSALVGSVRAGGTGVHPPTRSLKHLVSPPSLLDCTCPSGKGLQAQLQIFVLCMRAGMPTDQARFINVHRKSCMETPHSNFKGSMETIHEVCPCDKTHV